MLRDEHNRAWGVNRQPHENVYSHLGGYGEISQYDPRCHSCWLGHPHTWEKHDRTILGGLESQAAHCERNGLPYFRLNVLDPDGNIVGQYHDYSRSLDTAIEHAKRLVADAELCEVNVWLGDRHVASVRCDSAGRRLIVERRSESDPQVWTETLHYVTETEVPRATL